MPTLLAALLGLAVAASPASAQEEDAPVRIGGNPVVGAWPTRPSSAGASPGEMGPSDAFAEVYDTVLFQGELPDAHVGFEAAREEAGAWSPWVAATLKRSADGRFWAKVVFPAPGVGRLKFRALKPTGPSAAAVTIYSMHVYLSGTPAPAPPGGGSVTPSQADTLGVIERSAWGAKEPKNPYSPHVPNKFTQHHTSGRRPATLQESLDEVKFIQDFHINGRGWNDVGYHFLVDPEGRIFRGRPVDVIGAHVANDNTGNVGVSFMGTHHPPFNHPVTPAEMEASVRIGKWLQASYGVTPETYKGHRDRGTTKTDCPGDIMYARMEEVRAAWRGAPTLGAKLSAWWQTVTERNTKR
ncbi:N-acetylmuramoyl-L-alanine amidase [bacterium]|nr:MAG: N-acetylmuramoyl-L-alanine amidase [bacterium]